METKIAFLSYNRSQCTSQHNPERLVVSPPFKDKELKYKEAKRPLPPYTQNPAQIICDSQDRFQMTKSTDSCTLSFCTCKILYQKPHVIFASSPISTCSRGFLKPGFSLVHILDILLDSSCFTSFKMVCLSLIAIINKLFLFQSPADSAYKPLTSFK